jgi:hypothetical protein
MSRNGNGTYNLPAGNPVSSGSVITSTWANTTLSDIATALTGSIAADGQTPVTGNLNMAGNKVSNLGAGTLATDGANLAQVTSSVAITGGNINGTPIGQSTAAAGSFTALSASGQVTFSSTGSMKVPAGTTAQRNNNLLGSFRFNTTFGRFEGCIAVTAGATISTISHVTTVATLTTATAHGLVTGDFITVSGATPVAYNGTFQITVNTATEFTYVMATDPAANATVVGTYVYGTWGAVGGGATGGGNNQIFVLNDQIVTNDYTIPTGKNASSAGPITVDTGITVTIPTDSTWVIV